MAKKKEVDEAPNVQFIGGYHDTSMKGVKSGEEGFVPREPITAFTDGIQHYKLPEDQSKPFYFAESARLLRLYPQLYKSPVEKGK